MRFLSRSLLALSAVGLATAGATAANAGTITLDLSTLPTGAFFSPVTVDGFTLTPVNYPSSTPEIIDVNGTYALASTNTFPGNGADTLLTMVGGGDFSIVSVDVAATQGDDASYGIGISVYGGAGENFGANYGNPITSTFTTETLDIGSASTFDLDTIEGGGPGGNYAIADITVNVPEPASLLILGAGLLGVGLRRRKAKAV